MLAVVAVALAALSLVLLGRARTEAGEAVEEVLRSHPPLISRPAEPANDGVAFTRQTNFASTSGGGASLSIASARVSGLFLSLHFLGGLKLVVVIFIFRNTHQANHGDWNDKAVDYRYLAERLRSWFYLPRAGSFPAVCQRLYYYISPPPVPRRQRCCAESQACG